MMQPQGGGKSSLIKSQDPAETADQTDAGQTFLVC